MIRISAALWHGLLLIEDAENMDVPDLASDGKPGVGDSCIVMTTLHGDEGETQITLHEDERPSESSSTMTHLMNATIRIPSRRLCLRTTEGDTLAEVLLSKGEMVTVRIAVDDVASPSVIDIGYR